MTCIDVLKGRQGQIDRRQIDNHRILARAGALDDDIAGVQQIVEIVADAALHRIVADGAMQRVVSLQADEFVIAVLADNLIVQLVAGADAVARRNIERQVLDIGKATQIETVSGLFQ